MSFRLRVQLVEALGQLNRWYCSQKAGRMIENPDELLAYFVRSGGAADFARRFEEAMGPDNRWYCSEFYRRDIRDPQILWDYYMTYGAHRATRKHYAKTAGEKLSVAC